MIQNNDRRIVRHSPSQDIGERVLFWGAAWKLSMTSTRWRHAGRQAAPYARSRGRKCAVANSGMAHRRYDERRRWRWPQPPSRVYTSATLQSSSARHGGAVEWKQRYVSTASLKSIRCGTRSQCRWRSSGLTDSCYLRVSSPRRIVTICLLRLKMFLLSN